MGTRESANFSSAGECREFLEHEKHRNTEKKDYLMTIFPAPTAMEWNAENGISRLHLSYCWAWRKAILWMTAERLEKCEEWWETIQVNIQAEKSAVQRMSTLSAGGWTQNVLRRLITEAGG